MRPTRGTSIDAVLLPSRTHSLSSTPLLGGGGHEALELVADHLGEVVVLEVELRGARVDAGDLQEVGEQRLEAVELGREKLRGPGDGRARSRARCVVQHVRRHANGRERRAQLVRDIGHEAALQPRQVLHARDLALEGARHVVEGRGERRHLVVAPHAHALGQVAVGQA